MSDFKIRPSDVNLSIFGNTPWRNSEKETIAANLVKLARFPKGNKWEPFTWREYVEFCSHQAGQADLAILNELVDEGYLDYKEEAEAIFSFTLKIIKLFARYCH